MFIISTSASTYVILLLQPLFKVIGIYIYIWIFIYRYVYKLYLYVFTYMYMCVDIYVESKKPNT